MKVVDAKTLSYELFHNLVVLHKLAYEIKRAGHKNKRQHNLPKELVFFQGHGMYFVTFILLRCAHAINKVVVAGSNTSFIGVSHAAYFFHTGDTAA